MLEVVIAGVLLAFIAVTVASILLTTRLMAGKNEVRYSMMREAALLRTTLKNYVTADTTPVPNAPGSPPWHLPGDSCDDCWALAEGEHDVTARLPVDLRVTYGVTMKYKVTPKDTGGTIVRDVSISIDWKGE
jgi:hypothetical protein